MSEHQTSVLWVSSFSPEKKPSFFYLRIRFLTTTFLSMPSEVGYGSVDIDLGWPFVDFWLILRCQPVISLPLPTFSFMSEVLQDMLLPLFCALYKHSKLRFSLRCYISCRSSTCFPLSKVVWNLSAFGSSFPVFWSFLV